MLESKDLERLLTELFPSWQNDESAVIDWLGREQISEDFWHRLAEQLFFVTSEGVEEALREGEIQAMRDAILAGFQLAFFLGWESSKQYSPKRDMSRDLQEE